MKNRIYFFTSTGNSLKIAKNISNAKFISFPNAVTFYPMISGLKSFNKLAEKDLNQSIKVTLTSNIILSHPQLTRYPI